MSGVGAKLIFAHIEFTFDVLVEIRTSLVYSFTQWTYEYKTTCFKYVDSVLAV